MSELWPWLAVVLLGAYHGINPAMGWLFAVALGLQEKRRSAVIEALFPIALGHGASVAFVVALASGAELIVSPTALRVFGALALILFGAYKFLRPRSHPRWARMRVGLPELAVWSFLMSTAHGAGLMLFPVLLGLPMGEAGGHHVGLHPTTALLAERLVAILLHTLAMFVVMALAAVVVYQWLGVAILRRLWPNFDLLWAIVLVSAGVLTLLI